MMLLSPTSNLFMHSSCQLFFHIFRQYFSQKRRISLHSTKLFFYCLEDSQVRLGIKSPFTSSHDSVRQRNDTVLHFQYILLVIQYKKRDKNKIKISRLKKSGPKIVDVNMANPTFLPLCPTFTTLNCSFFFLSFFFFHLQKRLKYLV